MAGVGLIEVLIALVVAVFNPGAWLLLAVFCLKAAVLPLCLWLPGTYGAASPPVAALFAVMTKVGVYAVLRIYTLVFGADGGALANAAFPWIVGVAALGYAVAMLGALAGTDLRRLASMLLVGSAAFLLIGVGLASERSIAAAVFYLPHTTLTAAALYLLADLVAHRVRPAHEPAARPEGLTRPGPEVEAVDMARDQPVAKGQHGGQFIAAPIELDAQMPDVRHARNKPFKRAVAAALDDLDGFRPDHALPSRDGSSVKAPVAIATGCASSISVATARTKATDRVTW
jgi:hypothetical protein